tara:strand:- start:667 stop:1569 length:903 start_codon:yes stop_codon:yes gene_type:complete
MQINPFFSVVIPTYNCADLLNRSLLSVFAQTYKNFEIIVVDNSSTDNTNDVLRSFKDDRLSVIKVNNNGIIAYSRNKGINSSKGQWIAFLDSDDVWSPNKLDKVYSVINLNPEIILVCHDEWSFISNVRKNYLHYGPAGKDIYERLLFKSNCLSTSAVCINKEIAINTGGFSEKIKFITAEDYEYWIRLSRKGEFYFINEALGEWHVHNNNDSVGNPIKHASAITSVNEFHLDLWLKENPLDLKKVNKGKARMWSTSARILQTRNEFKEAVKYSKLSIQSKLFQFKAWIILVLSILKISK